MQYNYKELTSQLLNLDQLTLAQQCLKSIDNSILTGQLIRKLARLYTTQPEILLSLLSAFFRQEVIISSPSMYDSTSTLVEEELIIEDLEDSSDDLYVIETPVFTFNKIQELILVCLYRLNEPVRSKEIVKFSQRIIQYFTDETTRDNLMQTYKDSNTSRLTALIRSNTKILVQAGFLVCDKSDGYNKFKYSLSDSGNVVAASCSDYLTESHDIRPVSA